MKSYKSIITLGALALAFLTGCSDSDKWTPGPQDTDTGIRAYFEMPAKSSFIFDSDASASEMIVEVAVSRAITSEAASIPIILTSDAQGFSLLSPNAEFAAGEATTNVYVSCSGLEKGVKETFTLTLPADQTDIYGEGLLSVGYSVIKAQWIVASDQVTYSFNDAGNKRTYPNTYGVLYQLEGTKMFKLEDFFGSGLDVMFECTRAYDGTGVEFKPLNNADFYDWGDGYPGWYLYDEENQTWPEWVPGEVAGYAAIESVSFESDIDYTTVYMNYDIEDDGYSYIYFTTYVTQSDGNEAWGIWYAIFNLDIYNPFE